MRSSLLLLLGCGGPAALLPRDTLPCESNEGVGEAVTYDDGTMLCVRIEMPEEAFEALGAEQRFGTDEKDQWEGVINHVLTSCYEPFPDPYTWYEADVSVQGDRVEQVGVRKKGFIGSVLEGSQRRPSLKLKTDRFVEGQTLADTERITLNNNLTDRSRVRTCLTYSVFDDAGYPAPRCNLANVMVNGESLGAYTHVESPKKRFLRYAFDGDDEGSLYESTVADFTLGHLAGAPESLGRWEAKTSVTDTSGAPLIAVAEAILVDDDALEDALDAVLDLDAFFLFWALETVVGHQDGYAGNTNNTYVYVPEGDARAVLIPWGPDDALRAEGVDGFRQGALAHRLLQHEELRLRYADALRVVLDEVWDEPTLLSRIDAMTAQIETAETDGGHARSAEELKSWVEGRREAVEAYLDGFEDVWVPEETPSCSIGIEAQELTAVGEVLAVFSLGCSSAPGPGWLLWVGLCALRQRQTHKSGGAFALNE